MSILHVQFIGHTGTRLHSNKTTMNGLSIICVEYCARLDSLAKITIVDDDVI